MGWHCAVKSAGGKVLWQQINVAMSDNAYLTRYSRLFIQGNEVGVAQSGRLVPWP